MSTLQTGVPDYIRVGTSIWYVTWPRLLLATTLLFGVVLLSSEVALLWPTPAEGEISWGVSAPSPPPGGFFSSLRKGPSRGANGGGLRKSPPAVMAPFCKSAAKSMYFLPDRWQLAVAGAHGLPLDVDTGCDWLAATSTVPAFKMCTHPRGTDTQVSAVLHKTGVWSPGRLDTLSGALPSVTDGMDMPERTLVVDVGANIGFFSLLATSRGYDVIAFEPARQNVVRLLASLTANGVLVGASGRDVGGSSGHARRPVAHVFLNGLSDSYLSYSLRYVGDNPGATYLERADVPPIPAHVVPLDDLLEPAARGEGGAHPGLDVAPYIHPSKVRLVKISAEGMDARALHGMRRLLSAGKVPFVALIYTPDAIRNWGCDPDALMAAMFESGYAIFYSGVFISRKAELERFLKVLNPRGAELLFVRAGVAFA